MRGSVKEDDDRSWMDRVYVYTGALLFSELYDIL